MGSGKDSMQDQVDEIKQRLSIVDVVGSYLPLKQAGRNFRALCPFHQEKTPSFHLNPDFGIFKCFGCGETGDIFSFVMKMDHLEFREALEILADKAGVTLDDTKGLPRRDKQRKDKAFAVNKAVAKRYHEILYSPQGTDALAYLHDRGVTDVQIKQFCLGFAPPEWDTLSGSLGKSHLPLADELGLVINKNEGYHDRFRGRVMFPISDTHGRVIGFSGRLLDQYADPNFQQGKYINSPQSFLFDKSSALYGMPFAKNAIHEKGECYVVEGNLDVILMHQHDVPQTVAPLGTSLTRQHLHTIQTLTSTLVLVFDGDTAGRKALLRSIELCATVSLIPDSITLPQNEDPASLLASGILWKQISSSRQDGYWFHLKDSLEQEGSEGVAVQKKIQACLQFLSRIPSAPLQEIYRKKTAHFLGISEQSLIKSLPKMTMSDEQILPTLPKNETTITTDEALLLTMCILDPTLLLSLSEHLYPEDFSTSDGASSFSALLQTSAESSSLDRLEVLPEVVRLQITSFVFNDEEPLTNQQCLRVATSIKEKSLSRQLQALQKEIAHSDNSNEPSLLLQTMVELKKVLESLKEKGIGVYGSSKIAR